MNKPENKMHIYVGTDSVEQMAERFKEAWLKLEAGEEVQPEIRINFESVDMLMAELDKWMPD